MHDHYLVEHATVGAWVLRGCRLPGASQAERHLRPSRESFRLPFRDDHAATWLGVGKNDSYGNNGTPRLEESDDNPFRIEWGLLHELGHARYLIDWYAWNFNPHPGMDDVKVVRADGKRVLPPSTSFFYSCGGGMMSCVTPAGRERLYDDVDVFAFDRRLGQRPKCGNQNIKFAQGGGRMLRNFLPITFWTTVPLGNYICTHCGYVENYVLPSHLEKLRKADLPSVKKQN